MAKETKFKQVHPDTVESTIELWQMFGWELIGAPQEIYNKHQEFTHSSSNADHYRTETTHYVKITFQRDSNRPHFNELVNLENRYYSLPTNIPKNEPEKPKKFSVGSIILIILGLFIWIIPGIIIIIYKHFTFPNKLKSWEKEYALWMKRNDIRNEETSIIKRAKELTS